MKNIFLIIIMAIAVISCKNETKNALPKVEESHNEPEQIIKNTVERAEDKIDWVGEYAGTLNGVETILSLDADKTAMVEVKKGKKSAKAMSKINFNPDGSFVVKVGNDHREYQIIDGGIIDINTMMENLGKEEDISNEIVERFTIKKK